MIQKIKVDGMRCEHCKKRIETALSCEGFTAKADISSGVVTVEGDNAELSALQTIIEDLGFDYLGQA